METSNASLSELLAKGLPMNPLVSALLASPAVADASRRAITELTPLVERSIKGLRVAKFARAAGPTLLVSCFAAGVMFGWLTAPANGSETRARVRAHLRRWSKTAGERAQAGKLFLAKRLSRRSALSEADPQTSVGSGQREANGETGQAVEGAAHH